jgi:hypothetical protein
MAAWFLTPTPDLDVNHQVLQAQELAAVTMFACMGNPPASRPASEATSWLVTL